MENHKIESTTTSEAVKEINRLRLNNKNKWFCFHGVVNGNEIKAKCYNTWLQIFTVNGLNYTNPMEQNITQFKIHLINAFNK